MEYIAYKYPSVTFFVYKKYIIAEVKKGVDIYKTEANALKEVAQKHFAKEFGLIDYRQPEISINPNVYNHIKDTFQEPKLAAFALVSKSNLTQHNYVLEKKFMDELGITSKFFYSLDEAKKWMGNILGK